MLLPVPETEPTELMLAEPASHVIATLVLFDGLVTSRAILRIGHDPRNVFTFGRVLHLPVSRAFAISGFVRFLTALKTERIPTFAVYVHNAAVFIHHTVVASWEWAPPHFLVVVGI